MKRANRKRLTPKERAQMWADQHGLCKCGCGKPLAGKGDVGEHRFWFVALGCDEKPDALFLAECAKRKTNGPRGDINTISHIRQLAEGRTQHDRRNARGYPLIRDRGFDKTLSKKFSGDVVKR